MEKLIIICCLHGNERYGFEVCKNQSFFPFFLGNEEAFRENRRFIEKDLNRVFPGLELGSHEERLALKILDCVKDFHYVLDLHSSSNSCPMFGIITKPNNEKIEFAKRLGLKRLVIMPESFASGKAFIDFVKCGISLEVGPHNRKENVNETLELINNFKNSVNYQEKLEIYEVFDIIKKEQENILINNFDFVNRGKVIARSFDFNEVQLAQEDFVAVLVNEQAYFGVLCLACRKIG